LPTTKLKDRKSIVDHYIHKIYLLNPKLRYYILCSINFGNNSINRINIDILNPKNNVKNIEQLKLIEDLNKNSKLNQKIERKISPKLKIIIEKMMHFLNLYFTNKQPQELIHLDILENLILKNQDIFFKIPPFYLKCYQILCKTQKGDFLTYKQIAEKLNTKAYRVIGNAMKNNRFPILIPCHRVLSQSADNIILGGYLGAKSNIKLFGIKNTSNKNISKNETNQIKFLFHDSIQKLINCEKFNNIPFQLKIKALLLYFESCN